MSNLFLRYITLLIAGFLFLSSLLFLSAHEMFIWLLIISGALVTIGLHDVMQTKHAILRNYPILGHLRFFFEWIRPEIRQYFLEEDNSPIPFSRNQRSIVYRRAKQQLDKRPFGTQLDVYQTGYEWVNHSIKPAPVTTHDFRITIGADRAQPYSASIFNISAMSFGALSANAIRALNQGAQKGRFMHDTGEGGISRYHRPENDHESGGDLVWNIGSGYFGCRHPDGSFSEERFIANATLKQVKMIEVKLSQGAKPGHGGVLPGSKVTLEIAQARGVTPGVDCLSPSAHSAFQTPIELLQFIEKLRTLSGGKPTGFKCAVGHPWEFFSIVKAMLQTGIHPDFIVVDGSEGGTGAAPIEFTNHVGEPLHEALLFVHNTLVACNLRDKIKLGASGKIVSAFDILRILALGADWCNSARAFMFALGCIQSLSCHTDRCPTGVATQDPLRQRALYVPDKAERVYHFHLNTLKALSELVAAAGLTHPNQLSPHHVMQRLSPNHAKSLASLLTYLNPGDLLDPTRCNQLPEPYSLYWPTAQAESFQLS
jgi:glutamate synthase domain-containing protein 2